VYSTASLQIYSNTALKALQLKPPKERNETMNERQYTPFIVAACLAAFGLPALWIIDVALLGDGSWRDLLTRGPRFSDLLFLATGGLMAVAYQGFRSWLREQLNYRALDWPLKILIALTLAFHGAVFLLSMTGMVLPAEASVAIGIALWIGFLVLFGIVDLAIAIVLLRDRDQLPGLLMGYAGVSGLLGLMELSILFSPAALILLPLLLVLMALCLAYRPEYLEVV
jgi:hypothetical protein